MTVVGPTRKDMAIQCQFCQNVIIPNVYTYIQHVSQQDMYEGCTLAQLYYEWTHDDKVPISFAITNIEGILPARIENQTLNRIQTSIHLLKCLNAPFTKDAIIEKPKFNVLDILSDYIKTIKKEANKDVSNNDLAILESIITHFKAVLKNKKDKVEYYFDTLVPYIKACKKDDLVLLPPDQTSDNLFRELSNQLLRSQAIRKMYGMYCLSFELLHILVACYACCSNLKVVANWLFDLIARVCRGNFFWKNFETLHFIQDLFGIMQKITYKQNTDFYYLLKMIREGEGIEALSGNFKKYAELAQFLMSKLQAPANIEETVVYQLFPDILFESHVNQLAFLVGMVTAFDGIDRKTGQGKKGSKAFSKARHAYKIIQEIVQRIQKFDGNGQVPWTTETLQLFMASDSSVEKSLTELLGVTLETSEDNSS